MAVIDKKTWLKPTGRTRHRLGLFGRLVLQIEWKEIDDAPVETKLVWRDAKISDMSLEGDTN